MYKYIIDLQVMKKQEESQSSNYDGLNQARIESSGTSSSLISRTQSWGDKQVSRRSDKVLPQNLCFDYRDSFDQLLNSSLSDKEQFQTPSRSTEKADFNFDTTKTIGIKGKKGKLYKQICPVCLAEFEPRKAKLACGHKFCFSCIETWSKTSTACPCCRVIFDAIICIYRQGGLDKQQIIEVQPKKMQFNETDYYLCYQCGSGDDEHVLLICDHCDFYCCHIYCDENLRNRIPEGDWYCKFCEEIMGVNQQSQELSPSSLSKSETEGNSQAQFKELKRPIATRTRSRGLDLGNLRLLNSLRRR